MILSIVVPIYKVESYLKKCIDSIINWATEDIEIILVNDGSPDGSPQICEAYACMDKRVRVLHKENGGLSDARNAGIDCAQGEYIMFVDGDDYLIPGGVSSFIDKLVDQHPDILMYSNTDFLVNKSKQIEYSDRYDVSKIDFINKEAVLKYLFTSGNFPGSAWTVIVSRKFIIENKLYFTKGIKGEDTDWLLNIFLHAERFSAINDTSYVYLKYRDGSITNTFGMKNIYDLFQTIEKWIVMIQPAEYDYIRKDVYGFLSYHYSVLLVMISSLNSKERKKILKKVSNIKYLLKYGKTKKTQMVNFFEKTIGISLTCCILGFYYRLKKNVGF